MDKCLILAVAGSGKTTHILNYLDTERRHLLVTYTRENIRNLKVGIEAKFGYFPSNIKLYSYFEFLYSFCYKPFRARIDDVSGISWEHARNRIPENNRLHFFTGDGRVYHNRLSKILIRKGLLDRINERVEKYFDCFHIDEVQDFGGYDFDMLEQFAKQNIPLNWVGDFFQHTYDTSRDANKNQGLHSDLNRYLKRFKDAGLEIDLTTLLNSWRCSKSVTDFITENLKIQIGSNKKEDSQVLFIDDQKEVNKLIEDGSIIKLFYQGHVKYNCFSSNWGKLKGADHLIDVCIALNGTTLNLYKKGKLHESAPLTKNKLYVACSRANRHLYLVPESLCKDFKN